MILVFASQFDEIAQQTVARWPKSNAALLTVNDVCTKGWYIDHDNFNKSVIVIDNKSLSVKNVSGIITVKSYIFDYELLKIEKPDRPYVVAEISAFLYYLFSSLKVPQINPPTSYNLTGPSWRYEEWYRAAQYVRLPVKPYQRRTSGDENPPTDGIPIIKTIALLGKHIVRNDLNAFASEVCELAVLAGVQFLEITFVEENNQIFFNGVTCIPNLADPMIVGALHEYFRK